MPFAIADAIAELAVPAELGAVRQASGWLAQIAHEHNVPPEPIRRLDLCLNEALANTISYGGLGGRSAPIQLSLTVHSDLNANEATLTVSDAGTPFDPLEYQQRPRPQTLAEAEPGGLGIMMMRDAADTISYRYGEGCNHLAFSVRWTDAA